MFIKQITIEGVEGSVEIIRAEDGALITSGTRALCEITRAETPETRYLKAHEVARVICGQCRDRSTGRMVPNATNSMIHHVLNEIERVAGC